MSPVLSPAGRRQLTPAGWRRGPGLVALVAKMAAMARFFVAIAGLFCMVHATYLELVLCPSPQAGFNKGVDKIVGKLVFLTVQSILILQIYFILCVLESGAKLYGSEIKWLSRITNRYSSVVGGFAIFLTIMFYAICWSVLTVSNQWNNYYLQMFTYIVHDRLIQDVMRIFKKPNVNTAFAPRN